MFLPVFVHFVYIITHIFKGHFKLLVSIKVINASNKLSPQKYIEIILILPSTFWVSFPFVELQQQNLE